MPNSKARKEREMKMNRPNLVNIPMTAAEQRAMQLHLHSQQMQQNIQAQIMSSMVQMPPQSQPQLSMVKPIILDSSSAIKLSLGNSMFEERALMARNDIWHRILILRGSQFDKELILRSILRAVNPADLIPVKYQIVGQDSCFIARNCDKALEQLCKRNLIIPSLDGNSLILSITLGFASIHDLKINIQPILLSALKKRYNQQNKMLNLDNFHKDPEVYNTVYCPLSQSKTLAHVLRLTKNAHPTLECLNLQNNELSQLPILDSDSKSSNFKSLKYVDLRNNHLLRVEVLEPLKTWGVTELWLDKNPMCENYSSPRQYVEAVRMYCSQLSKLDGIPIGTAGLPIIFKSYVKNWKKRKLVEQFVEHFFRAYDYRDRNIMRGLYHQDAWYSITVGTPTSPTSKKCLEPFSHENRNLLIFGKNSQQLLHHGEEQILKFIKKMPQSQHILKSFCADLIYDANDTIVICVSGLFRLTNNTCQLYSFNRTFILSSEEDCEYKIRNDQYHVYLPINKVVDFNSLHVKNEKHSVFEPNCFSPSEQSNIAITFQESTMMKLEHCERYLKEAHWNIKDALNNFLVDFKGGYVPRDSFLEDKCPQMIF